MNKHTFTALCCCTLVVYCVVPCYAIKWKIARTSFKAPSKSIVQALQRKTANITYVPPTSPTLPQPVQAVKALEHQPVIPATPVFTDELISLSDGKTKEKGKHSIVPSAVTILGSQAIKRAQERSIAFLYRQAQVENMSEYLPVAERKRWKHEFETLRALWVKEQPSRIEDLPRYLTHEVPPETLAYLQQRYTKLVKLIAEKHQEVMSKVVYSSLQNEGKRLGLQETRDLNELIFTMRLEINTLLKAIKNDPYLLIQQKYWDSMFGAFNPLIKGLILKSNSIFRQDTRKFELMQFALHNPDGSSPYLPNSDSMIAGESFLEEDDDDFDEEQYSGQLEALKRQAARREAQRQHHRKMVLLAEQEREALLQHIPAGQHIAVINDDLLPLLNFQNWAKRGLLGKDATVETFRDGFSFMQQVRNGKRYDIVITDLIVPDGGVSMMENFRLLDARAAVFASSKFYPGDGDDHSSQDLFNFGMDGYMWYNTNLNEGAFGYLQVLRQLNNYYYYKNKYGWER